MDISSLARTRHELVSTNEFGTMRSKRSRISLEGWDLELFSWLLSINIHETKFLFTSVFPENESLADTQTNTLWLEYLHLKRLGCHLQSSWWLGKYPAKEPNPTI